MPVSAQVEVDGELPAGTFEPPIRASSVSPAGYV